MPSVNEWNRIRSFVDWIEREKKRRRKEKHFDRNIGGKGSGKRDEKDHSLNPGIEDFINHAGRVVYGWRVYFPSIVKYGRNGGVIRGGIVARS